MKELITIIVLFLGITLSAQENENAEGKTITIITTFAGSNNDVYYFKDEISDEIISFNDVKQEIIDQGDLKEVNQVGSLFKLKYKIISVEVDSKDDIENGEKVIVKSFLPKYILLGVEEKTDSINKE